MVRIVIDANVLISAAFGGTPLDAVGKAFAVGEVCVSPQSGEEIDKTIHRLGTKLGSERTRALLALWARLRDRCTLFEPTQVMRVCRDPKDDAYLALCVAAGADVLITGDQDLLVIDPGRTPVLPQGMKILTPRQFLDQER
jgi:putative PIN family toxin of toxin-antitoxin system